MPLLRDAMAAGSAAATAAKSTGEAPVERINWVPAFQDEGKVEETTTDFCAATDPAGSLESNSSAGHREYQDRLRAIALREEGMDKGEIAATLKRSPKFVERWWRKEPNQVPRPQGVHEYLKSSFWRDIEIVRGFGKGLGIYDEIMSSVEWLQPMAFGSEFRGGGSRLKYDKEGRMRPQGNQAAKDGLLPGRMHTLDKLTQKLLSEKDIDDRVLKRPNLLWYPDGTSDAIPHRHEAWTALMSFGAPRILTMDGHPVLLRDGDLIIFGTQRHGVPRMREESGSFDGYGGRISAVFFFMPAGKQAEGAEPWKAIFDGGASGPSRKASAMLQSAALGSTAEVQGLATGAKAADVAQLVAMGFSEREAAQALKAAGFDLARAAEVLLCGGLALCEDPLGVNLATPNKEALYARLTELRSLGSGACAPDENWEEQAILQQLQELESADSFACCGGTDLAAQFAQYDEMLEAQDAEEWDGRGDLMVREWRREYLNVEQQEPSTVWAFGCGQLLEKRLFELLSLHSIRVLYDFRSEPETGPVHFRPDALKLACKSRGLVYRHIALGREGAYGILKHLREDEGRNALAELVWYARRKRSAMLGKDEDWRQDHRLAIAARLREAGHRVEHVLPDGTPEVHPDSIPVPDFIASEEQRLRLLEKQRLSGDLRRPQKSAVSRSTESVAQRLAKPRVEIDVAAELRKADTQAELVRTQRRLADLQRRGEATDAKAGLGPKLVGYNKFVLEEAETQKANLAAGKTKDGKDRDKASTAGGAAPAYVWTGSGGTGGGNPIWQPRPDAATSSAASSALPSSAAPVDASTASAVAPAAASSAAAAEEEFMVECSRCAAAFAWAELEEGDGICQGCIAAALFPAAAEAGPVAETATGPALAAGASRRPGHREDAAARPAAQDSGTSPAEGSADATGDASDAAAVAGEAAAAGECSGQRTGEELGRGCAAASRRVSWRAQRHSQRRMLKDS